MQSFMQGGSPITHRGGHIDGLSARRQEAWGVQKQEARDKLREGAALYFKENRGSVPSAGMLWEAFKAVLRGKAQALTGVARKEMRLQCIAMEIEVMELEGLALASRDPEDRDKLKLRVGRSPYPFMPMTYSYMF
ncbi:hypothetical protein NDU88_001347 [Pleurodeles waltl]|uniref:Uncharacterized protein n=1 Tax=Pleurodeles waltl TaxID=8319 RepID=A0AAV7LZ35_PLEWA|nr:hypothetical protein NDU88_001347 [Pleurodeles waltl]